MTTQDEISVPEEPPPAGAQAEHGWLGRLELAFERQPGAAGEGGDVTTRLALRRHQGPLRLLRTLASDDGRRVEAVIVHPPGGLVAGDRLQLAVRAGRDTAVVLTTPGAQKWYRSSDGRVAAVETRLVLEEGAALDWLPQPSILFDGARASQALVVEMAATATTVGWEMMVRGRAAMGEQWRSGTLDQRLAIEVDGRPWWQQRLLAEAGDRLFASPLGWRDRRCAVAVWHCAPSGTRAETEALRDRWRARLAARPAEEVGIGEGGKDVGGMGDRGIGDATAVCDGLVLAQMLGDDIEALQTQAMALWRQARDGASLPRIWQT